ncbi:MerR family transcriptional regulator [Deinococcus sonorensis]|uniref:MerR family transcriptional regulator n=2 Tax=Deinococcus sonorensis TaxID=309891 RepID=A0AAU7U8K8_9DEIO
MTAATAIGYSIREAALELGVSVHTLRYYEREGLLSVPRLDSAQRRYGPQELERLRFLLALRGTGMSMALIRRYMRLVGQGDGTVAERRALLLEHQQAVTEQIRTLQHDLGAIRRKLEIYDRLTGRTEGVN